MKKLFIKLSVITSFFLFQCQEIESIESNKIEQIKSASESVNISIEEAQNYLTNQLKNNRRSSELPY